MDIPAGSTLQPKTVADSSAEFQHVTQEMYKKNLELTERNKTLSLLRQIDEIVLSPISGPKEVAQQIAAKVALETDFDLVMLLIANREKQQLVSTAVAYGEGEKTIPPELTQALLSSSFSLNNPPKVIAQAMANQGIVLSEDLGEIFTNKLERNLLQSLQASLDLRSIFVAALGSKRDLIGIMVIGSRLQESALSEFQQNLIDRLAGTIGIALDNKLLYQEIQQARVRLEASNKRLKELDEAKDEFISMASHQLRTPLTSIKGYLSMLEEGDAGKLNKNQYEFADSAFTSAQRMIYLISDMLNVSRISTGKLVIEKTTIDLDRVVRDEIKQLERTATTHQVKLHYNPPPQALPPVSLDEGKIRQVIMNFMDNAVYYAPGSTVEVCLIQDVGKIKFEVSDHGIGVPKEAQSHLFTKFYRAENAQKARPDGTGLGLFMAKMVIELQGGTVIFNSEEGKGSTFGFEFILDKVLASAVKQPAAKLATPLTMPVVTAPRNQSNAAASA